MIKNIILGMVALMWAIPASAGDVVVTGAWVRATAPGQDTAAVSLNIISEKEARLVAVSSPAAKKAELHTMKHENGMMVMRAVDALALPAKQQVSLGAGDHIMLLGLKHPLKAGNSMPLRLTVEFADKRKETVGIKAEVRPLTTSNSMQDKGMQGMPGMGGM